MGIFGGINFALSNFLTGEDILHGEELDFQVLFLKRIEIR